MEQGRIDSMNFSGVNNIMFDSSNYSIETVKSIGVFEPHRWSESFGKSLTKNIVEAKILHTNLGLELPIKTYVSKRDCDVLEFAGLHGYNLRSEYLTTLLKELIVPLSDCYINRIDIAVDYEQIPKRVFKTLSKHRQAFKYKNTVYYKTNKEKKTNAKLDIKIYDKAKKENLPYPLERLEFVFKVGFLKNLKYSNLEDFIPKMEKTIKRFSGETVNILLPL